MYAAASVPRVTDWWNRNIVIFQIFNHRSGDRPNAQDVLIIFTDGRAHDFNIALKHAKAMRSRNVHIIAIAAGHEAKDPKLLKQLKQIVSDPLEVYTSEFSELTDIIDRLIDIDCVVQPRDTPVKKP